jgi:hypothetical protein
VITIPVALVCLTVLIGAQVLSEMTEKRASRKPKSPRVFGHTSRRVKIELRVGLYARVSAQDQKTIPMQTRALREYAARRGSACKIPTRTSTTETAID